jgi:hypothetical protein
MVLGGDTGTQASGQDSYRTDYLVMHEKNSPPKINFGMRIKLKSGAKNKSRTTEVVRPV